MILVCGVTSAVARSRDLTDSEARGLLLAFLGNHVTALPHFGLDPLECFTTREFYAFEATAMHPNNPEASPIIGSFAVNRATGDVWRLVVCERAGSAALSRAQASLRKRIKLGRNELRQLGAKAPCEP